MKKQYTRKLIFDLPKEKENLKHVSLDEINPIYQLYEDGSIFSRVAGCFKEPYTKMHKTYLTLNIKGKGTTTFSIDKLIRKYIIGDITPEIEGVEHKPMLGYEGIYQIYSNGQVWSYVKGRWMTACLQSRKKYLLYCLQDAEGKVTTQYVHRLLAQNFILKAPLNDCQVHHKNNNPKDNSLSNLSVLTPLEHKQFHREKIISQQVKARREAVKAQKEKEKEERRQYRLEHPYHHSQQTRKKISMSRKKHFNKLRGE